MIVFRRRGRLRSIIMSKSIQLQTLILILVWIPALGSPISKSAVSCPASHPGWRSWKEEKCILYHSSDVDYETGERNCQSIGSQLVTITSAEEEDFVISLLKEKAVPNKSHALYFWIDRTNTVKGIGFSSNPLGTPIAKCPPAAATAAYNNDSSSISSFCPAKVVKASGRKAFWCNFDCNKEFVNAICEIIIKKRDPASEHSLSKTTTRKRDISTKGTLGAALPLTSTRRLTPSSSSFFSSSSSPSSSAPPSAVSFPPLPPSDLTATTPVTITRLYCEVGWKLHDDKCYKSIQMDTNGNEARNLCQFRDSAHLASITSSPIQQAIQTLVTNAKEAFNRPLLIDGRYDRGSRVFRWSETSQLFRYTNWAPGQPDLDHECVAMETNKTSSHFAAWKTIDCNQDANLLCSKPGRQSHATTMTASSSTEERSSNMETGEERTSTAIPAAAVTKSACGTTSSRKERQQQEVAFDAAMMGCNESLDNGGEGSTAGRDGRHDDGREMVDHDDDVMSEAEEEEKRASAGGDERRTGKGAGSGAKGVVSVNRETGIPDAGSDNISGNDRSLTTGGSLTLSLLILVLAGILLIICFLLRIRDMRREKRGGGIRGGNETKVISLQRSQHDSNIYFDKSPVTPMSDADVDDPDISLFDKSAFTDKS